MTRRAVTVDELLAVPLLERDVWVDERLGFSRELPADAELPAGSVPYLPASADVIARVVREAPVRADDVFVDLGAGIGRPCLLVHALTGARAIGVELQPQLVAMARARASAKVTFLEGDAAELLPVEGTVFFIYASFNGAKLEQVLERLRALPHAFVLCAVDFEVHVPWLTERKTSDVSLKIYEKPLS